MPPEEVVTRAEEAPPYNELSDNEKQYVLFTDGSRRIVGKHQRWKAAVWSPTPQVAEATQGEGESSQFADLDWEHKGELFLARWAHDTSGHQGRDATYKWARD